MPAIRSNKETGHCGDKGEWLWRSSEVATRQISTATSWRQFNRAVRASGDVGIWHETFRVRAGEYEAVYGNMPVFGLAAAARHLPAGRKGDTAAARIGASSTDDPAVAPY
ncbi:MAG: monooxygenase family protein [Streptosporangiaceae bacterium]